MRNSNLRFMTQLALLVAIELIMAYTPLGMIPMGIINASLLTIPVAVGAMVLGPVAGGIMGAIFGITSFMNAVQGKSALGVALMEANPAGYFLQAVIGRILCGVCCALIYMAVKKLMPQRDKLCCAIGGVAAPLLNTFFYMGFMMLLFYNTEFIQNVAAGKGVSNPFSLVIAMVGVQGLVEAITCCVIATAVTVPVLHFVAKTKPAVVTGQ